jgi:class 3 adenylate cyclase
MLGYITIASMSVDFEALGQTLGMTEIIRLQNVLSRELTRRFEKAVALAFSDLVGSTPYFARFGDEAGRRLQQRHLDLLQAAIARGSGRIVDTAGDGAFLAFGSADEAITAMIESQKLISAENLAQSREHQLNVRQGVHYGSVLTDGIIVTGDAVNLCSRVSGSADPGEIRTTREAFLALTNAAYRVICRTVPSVILKGFARPVDVMAVEWRDPNVFPYAVVIEETRQETVLPSQDIITFGRLREHNGAPANDVVIELGDPGLSNKISRWHFELRRKATGFVLHSLSSQPTEVDGATLVSGQQAPVRPGSRVVVNRVATLLFLVRPNTAMSDASVGTCLPDGGSFFTP